MSTSSEHGGPVLLFDGVCGLCNRVVRLLLRLDRRGVLRFAALQGEPAQEFLRAHDLPTEDFSTLVLVPDWSRRSGENYLLRTDAVVVALWMCGGASRVLAAMLRAVPRRLRDAGYRFVARTRYRFFGPWQACPLPRPEWARRFLE
ncbi:MAG TPA: DCC1-like thiol-disulfide oxidoreductase family protein [Opitutaceae bacterium]|nr:DCC1-like thiol-disulfide oxidoreductase family protein [Opitutaceae bacterium]